MRTSFTKIATLVSLVMAVGLFPAAPADAREKTLTIAFIPQENPEKLIGDISRVTRYLKARMGMPVKGFVTQDHAAAVEALKNRDADISFMGALPYVMARETVGAEILLAEVYRGRPFYSAGIFVRRDGGIAAPAGLKGKTIAFADPISESGYLYPLEIFVGKKLLSRGADPNGFFKRVYFAGGYQQAIQAVANGLVDAAGVSIYAILQLPLDQRPGLKMIAESAPIPSHAVIARKGLDPHTRRKFVDAMLALNKPKNRHLLKHLYAPDGYVVPPAGAYDKVAKLARLYGLIK